VSESTVEAAVCAEVGTLPDQVQVAWVSRVGARAANEQGVQVVRVSDLRRLSDQRGKDPTAVLQALGLGGRRPHGKWKVVVFDVKKDWLCRPALGNPEDDLGGLDTCEEKWQKPGPGTFPASYSGCGYLLDTQTGQRTLDVYRVRWRTAVSWGFCVLPFERFVKGA
jgi:hypothetical protein